jgi:hypothetical protein
MFNGLDRSFELLNLRYRREACEILCFAKSHSLSLYIYIKPLNPQHQVTHCTNSHTRSPYIIPHLTALSPNRGTSFPWNANTPYKSWGKPLLWILLVVLRFSEKFSFWERLKEIEKLKFEKESERRRRGLPISCREGGSTTLPTLHSPCSFPHLTGLFETLSKFPLCLDLLCLLWALCLCAEPYLHCT